MKVLTYNISWESMTGSRADWPFCNNKTNTESSRHYMRCVENIASVIDKNGPYDFIGLQEAANWKLLVEQSAVLKSMKFRSHKSGPEDMVTFWDPKKHEFIKSLNGFFEPGRPWSALFFKDGICYINVHAGHYNFITLTSHLLKVVILIEDYVAKNAIFSTDFRIIMGGDFNSIINKDYTKIIMSKKTFHMFPKRFSTFSRSNPNRGTQYDHIIDTKNAPTKVYLPSTEKMASDHLPVIAILEPQGSAPIVSGKIYTAKVSTGTRDPKISSQSSSESQKSRKTRSRTPSVEKKPVPVVVGEVVDEPPNIAAPVVVAKPEAKPVVVVKPAAKPIAKPVVVVKPAAKPVAKQPVVIAKVPVVPIEKRMPVTITIKESNLI